MKHVMEGSANVALDLYADRGDRCLNLCQQESDID